MKTAFQEPQTRPATSRNGNSLVWVGIFAAAWGWLALPLLRAEASGLKLEVEFPCQAERSNPVTHEVDFSVVITPPYHCETLRVWLPLPPSDDTQEISGSKLSTFPMRAEPQIAQEPIFGNRFAHFVFRKPEGAQIIRHRFRAKVWDLRWNVDPGQVASVQEWPQEFQPYLKPHPLAQAPSFVQTLRAVAPAEGDNSLSLFGAMEWIDRHLVYDHVDASLRADAAHAFTKLRGHCSDYHGLCATMGRALGYPTRVTYGLSLFPKNSPSHCKLEAFLPPYGWVSFDISETQKLAQATQKNASFTDADKARLIEAARRRLRRGFRENSWLLVTRGVDYELAPRASRPVSVVRTIYAEADGQPLPEPDPANAQQREFAWMTVHHYQADRPFPRPFQDVSTLTQDARLEQP